MSKRSTTTEPVHLTPDTGRPDPRPPAAAISRA